MSIRKGDVVKIIYSFDKELKNKTFIVDNVLSDVIGLKKDEHSRDILWTIKNNIELHKNERILF
jgi:hypothetical protein